MTLLKILNGRFSLECITKWTDHNPTCPLCSKEINTILKKSESEEDVKENTYQVKVSPKESKKQAEEGKKLL